MSVKFSTLAATDSCSPTITLTTLITHSDSDPYIKTWCQRVWQCQREDDSSELPDSTSSLSSEEPLNGPILPEDLPVHPDSEPMNLQDIWEIFDIRVEGGPFFPVPRSHLLSLPKDLESELDNLTTCHDRLNTILKYCLGAERDARRSEKARTDHLGHHFTFSRAGQLQLTATNRRKTKEIIGQADYTIWQGDESTTSGLIVAGTEDEKDLGTVKLRCFAYMSIARSLRQQTPKIVYGIVTDGSIFEFMSIDSNGRVNGWRPCTSWNSKTAPATYTTFRLALHHPATPPCVPAEALQLKGEDKEIPSFEYYYYYRGLLTD